MKSTAIILILFAFLVQNTNEWWMIAAFKMNQTYIAENWCINRFDAIPICKGSCVLENQINQKRQNEEKMPDIKSKDFHFFCTHAFSYITYQPKFVVLPKQYASAYIIFIATADLQSVFRPPSDFFLI